MRLVPDLIFRTSGVNQELLGMADDASTGIEVMLRQGAGLVTLQKYFDQWDVALKLLGRLEQKIIQNKWSPSKIARILGKEPNPEFLAKTFSRYDVMVAEGLNTVIQQQAEFLQIRQLNEMVGGIIPPQFIIQKSTIQGKNEIIAAVMEQQQGQQQAQQQQQLLEQTILEGKLQEMQARSVGLLAAARERHGRAESNIGLFEERISEISRNRALALKDKVEALQKLVELYATYGEMASYQEEAQLDQMEARQEMSEDVESRQAKASNEANNFVMQMMQNNSSQSTMNQRQPEMGSEPQSQNMGLPGG